MTNHFFLPFPPDRWSQQLVFFLPSCNQDGHIEQNSHDTWNNVERLSLTNFHRALRANAPVSVVHFSGGWAKCYHMACHDLDFV